MCDYGVIDILIKIMVACLGLVVWMLVGCLWEVLEDIHIVLRIITTGIASIAFVCVDIVLVLYIIYG
jgi:hypothetical protein